VARTMSSLLIFLPYSVQHVRRYLGSHISDAVMKRLKIRHTVSTHTVLHELKEKEIQRNDIRRTLGPRNWSVAPNPTILEGFLEGFSNLQTPMCRSPWPRGLRRRSWSLGRWDHGFESRLSLKVWMFVLVYSLSVTCHLSSTLCSQVTEKEY
jgi:hypothetical protein